MNQNSTSVPLKRSTNRRFSDLFRRYRNGTLVQNGLIATYLIQKKGFSNLFVDRMFSMVAFRISMLIISLKDDFLKRSVFVRFDKLNLDTWG